jgi:hypothetical protein
MTEDFAELIERSSLGTPAAKAIRARTPPDVARRIVDRANELIALREAASAPYVIDRDNVVWKVVRDGGMVTRADYNGIVSGGIQWLAETAGPLTPFDPSSIAPLVEDNRRLREALERMADDHPFVMDSDSGAMVASWFVHEARAALSPGHDGEEQT